MQRHDCVAEPMGPKRTRTIACTTVAVLGSGSGSPTRWVFSDVTRTTFLWEGFTKDTPDSDWRMDQRMTGQRTA